MAIDVMTKPETAAYLKVAIRTLDHWVQNGQFPAGVKLGPKLYWKRSVIDAWVEKRFEEQENALK